MSGRSVADALGAQEVAERVVAVGGAGAEEDEVEQALEAAGVAQAGEQFGEVARERLGGGAERLQAGEQRLDRDERRPGLRWRSCRGS